LEVLVLSERAFALHKALMFRGGTMFELITGEARHIPSKPALPIFISTAAQAIIVAGILIPVLLVTGALPETPTMMAFVAAPPSPPPPPPPPPPPAAAEKSTPPETQPVPTSSAAPVDVPSRIEPEPVAGVGDAGVPGGLEGGIPGGVPGGVVGGLPTDLPPPPPPPPAPERRDPVRVGGQIKEPTLLRRVEPVYPMLAVHANIRGTVIVEAIVDAEGRVTDVKLLRPVHQLLDHAAVEAVRQWQYAPLILNGTPERFVLTVVLSFNLT
jgi:protein TonB